MNKQGLGSGVQGNVAPEFPSLERAVGQNDPALMDRQRGVARS